MDAIFGYFLKTIEQQYVEPFIQEYIDIFVMRGINKIYSTILKKKVKTLCENQEQEPDQLTYKTNLGKPDNSEQIEQLSVKNIEILEERFEELPLVTYETEHPLPSEDNDVMVNTTNLRNLPRPMKKFPKDPSIFHPVRLLKQLKPGSIFEHTTLSEHYPPSFKAFCRVDEIEFTGEASSKKHATKECCIQAIKKFWNYDFHKSENQFDAVDLQIPNSGSGDPKANIVITPPSARPMKKFPKDPSTYHPVRLLKQLKPGTIFVHTTLSEHYPPSFKAFCRVNDIEFTGEGSTKKLATKECCIEALNHFWQFDFNALEQ